MHELSIASAIVEEAIKAVKTRGKISRIRVKVGELNFLTLDELKGAYQIASSGSPVESAELEVEVEPSIIRCLNCGFEGRQRLDEESHRISSLIKAALCPNCGNIASKVVSGEGISIVEIT